MATGPDDAVYVVGDVSQANMEGGGFFIRKYGPAGNPQWKDTTEGGWVHGADVPEVATGVAVSGTRVVVTGHGYGCCGSRLDDGWIRLYRSDGTLLWAKRRCEDLRRTPRHQPSLPMELVGQEFMASVATVSSSSVTGWR